MLTESLAVVGIKIQEEEKNQEGDSSGWPTKSRSVHINGGYGEYRQVDEETPSPRNMICEYATDQRSNDTCTANEIRIQTEAKTYRRIGLHSPSCTDQTAVLAALLERG